MTNDEAKFLLQGYRPNGQDANNPAFAEALAQAERDPALRAWFEREQAFDAVIAGKLKDLAPPAGLRESILAGTRLSTASVVVERKQAAWWRGAWGIGMAAAAAVALMATLWLNPRGGAVVVALPSADLLLKTAMADYRGAHPSGHPHASELGDFGAWLESDLARLAQGPMPAQLKTLAKDGCRTIDLAGVQLFEICFQRNGSWFHVYLAPRDQFEAGSLHAEPMFHEQGRFVAASWADEEYVYLVSTTAGVDSLRGLL